MLPWFSDAMSSLPKPHLTPEEYLEIERKAEYKSEYYQGEMFAMSGARLPHNLIAKSAMLDLDAQLRQRGCEIVGSDQRVHVPATGLYTYPDLVAFCGEPQFLDAELDTLLNPVLIIEVLSPSTEMYDRTLKWEQYQSIESLQEYLLISTDRIHADLYSRQASGRWLLTSASRFEDSLEIPSLGCTLKLAALYGRVKF